MRGEENKGRLVLDFDAMTTAFPLAEVERALEASEVMSQRYRKLPVQTVVYLVIALGLMAGQGAKAVLRQLLDKVRTRQWIGGVPLASEAAICKARKKVGYEPLKKLFEQVARPIAVRRTRGGWSWDGDW